MAQGTDISVFLNHVWDTASSAYQDTIPLATADNIKDVGDAVLNAPQYVRNEFMENVFNKIGMTTVDMPVVDNRLSFLKKQNLEYGQTIEDIYVGLAQSEPYITGMKEGETVPDPFSIRKVPHKSAFYSTILSRQYHITRHLTDLRKAFTNAGSMAEFIAGIMNAISSRENWDDWRMTIALMARQIEASLNSDNFKGAVHLISDFNAKYYPPDSEGTPNPDAITAETAFQNKDFLKYFTNQLKKWSKRVRNLRTDLNVAGVPNLLPQGRQRIMMLEDITVDFETELLAWAYNSGNLQIGGVDEIDAWYSVGADATDPPVVSPEDIEVKSTFSVNGTSTQCVGVIYDPGMLRIHNKERIASDQTNGKGNYTNMFLSTEDIFACSPYRNFVVFLLD